MPLGNFYRIYFPEAPEVSPAYQSPGGYKNFYPLLRSLLFLAPQEYRLAVRLSGPGAHRFDLREYRRVHIFLSFAGSVFRLKLWGLGVLGERDRSMPAEKRKLGRKYFHRKNNGTWSVFLL